MGVHGRHDEAMRVILVGRTGLDQALRVEPRVELVRARTALDAIGELAQPVDDESPSRSVIVVGDDGEPGDGTGAKDFVEAARDVDPTVRIVRVGLRGSGRAAYDGYVRPSSDLEALRRAAAGEFEADEGDANGNGASDAERAGPASGVASLISSILRQGRGQVGGQVGGQVVGARESERGPAEAARADGSQGEVLCGHGALGDGHVVEAMVRGGDVTSAALDVLRVRLGTPDVRFVASVPGSPEVPMGSGGGAGVVRERVVWGDALLGMLEVEGGVVGAGGVGGTGGGTDGGTGGGLVEHARWLAGWIRLRDQQQELRHAAFTDPLTGAWNRRYFDRFLGSVIEQCRVNRRNLTLMVFDIDDFKVYNDRYGHGAGDEILTETVRLMRKVVRPTDRVCRIGGDEFAVIFYEPDGPREVNSRHPDSVCKIAQRFQDQIARHCFPKLGSEAPGTLTVSGGLATYPWDGTTAAELLERADELALESKRMGKNVLMMGPRALRRNE